VPIKPLTHSRGGAYHEPPDRSPLASLARALLFDMRNEEGRRTGDPGPFSPPLFCTRQSTCPRLPLESAAFGDVLHMIALVEKREKRARSFRCLHISSTCALVVVLDGGPHRIEKHSTHPEAAQWFGHSWRASKGRGGASHSREKTRTLSGVFQVRTLPPPRPLGALRGSGGGHSRPSQAVVYP